tara:strand:- start:506 stop:1588 length:1083 start_codon:yes stop_codon:yes gene_type:complete
MGVNHPQILRERNMTKIPNRKNNIIDLINKAHENKSEKPRPHFGASQAGHKCDRWLWLSFRWAVQPNFPGRILRLFRRGHHEENWIVDDLKEIGIRITHTGKIQKRVDFGCHVSGSLDGIIESGIPEAPNKKHIAEFKTHGLRSFQDLTKNGVEKSKPIHYAQMQLYMLGTDIDRALYVAVCKNDDQIHIERVKFNKKYAEKLLERAKKIALAERMPDPISTDPSWYECKFCDAYDFCHKETLTKHVNCRTCAHVTPNENGEWDCTRHENGENIPVEYQHIGCSDHVLHPDIVPWEMCHSDNPNEAVYQMKKGKVINGESGFSSKEIVISGEACADDLVKAVKNVFPDSKITEVDDATNV